MACWRCPKCGARNCGMDYCSYCGWSEDVTINYTAVGKALAAVAYCFWAGWICA